MPQSAESEFDNSKSEAFADRMLSVLNGGALCLMTSIGHRTGLFDVMSETPPATSEQIARRANLNERYVREWLGAMVTGGVIEYDAQARTYRLPSEHAAFLTRAAGSDNIASPTQWLSVLGGVESRVVECFRQGGGVPYEAYDRFHEVMAEESNLTTVSALIDSILPLADGLIEKLRAGAKALDIGCGSGRAVLTMAREFPSSEFVGYDISEEAIALANEQAKRDGLRNARFEARDISALDEPRRYDLITAFDVIHDQRAPDEALAQVASALKPEGVFLMQDIAGSSSVEKNLDGPLAPFIYTISCMHCMSVSLAQGGAGLGAAWGREKALEMLREAGFQNVRVEELPHDILNCYYVAHLSPSASASVEGVSGRATRDIV